MGKRNQKDDDRSREYIRVYYAGGDEQGLTPLLASFRELLLAYTRGRLGIYDQGLCKEICSTVLVRVLGQLREKRIDPESNIWAWVCIAAKLALTEYYGDLSKTPSQPGSAEDPFLLGRGEMVTHASELPEDAEAESRAARTVALATQAMLALDPNARACIHLHYYKSIPVEAAAQQLGISTSTFNSRLFRGLQALQAWAQQNPGLALSGDEYAALPRVDTGKLFDNSEVPESERQRQAKAGQNRNYRARKVQELGGEEEYKQQEAKKQRERRAQARTANE